MKSTVQFIRKNLIRFSFSLLILLIMNLILSVYWSYKVFKIDSSILNPNMMNRMLVSQINESSSSIIVNEKDLSTLRENNIWVMLIDEDTGNVIWSQDLPDEVPTNYSIKDIVQFTRYYLKDYPVFTYVDNNKGILVLGYPKDSYAKLPTSTFPIEFLRNLPINIMYYLLFNLIIVFLIYMVSKRKLLKSIEPVANAICKISNGEEVQLKEKGDLLDIKIAVNKTSQYLRERDSMRVNWITGISHDIRTPLSLIMGYANHLLQSKNINARERKELELIQSNSTQIQSLISNLNLTSRLEYNLVSVKKSSVSIIKVLREIIVDYMNHDSQNLYDIDFISDNISSSTMILGDARLLERAFRNIILNSMTHNAKGCKIQIKLSMDDTGVNIDIADNGIGVSKDKLISLNTSISEYIKKNNTTNKSHGLGLLIVKQIIELHQGSVTFTSLENYGFNTKITLPLYNHNN